MNGDIIPFSFEGAAVRVHVDDAGQPWFNCSDVCAALEFGNPRQAVESHVDADDVQKLDAIDGLGRTQLANHVNESGVYSLIFGSTKVKAKRFKRWVTSEVLPMIRRTGSYSSAVAAPYFEIPQTYSGALRLAADQCERADRADARVAELEPKGEFVDRYVDAEGAKGVREVCQVLNANEKEFTHFLEKDAGVMYRLGGRLAPMSTHRGSGRFVVKAGVSDGGRAYNQARFTPKGVRWIAGLWAQFQLDPQAFRDHRAKVKRTDESGSNEERV